jgi:peroxiredoxin
MGCPGCIQEIPQLHFVYDAFKADSNFRMYGITFDSKEDLLPFLNKKTINYPVAFVQPKEEVRRLNYGQGFPTTVLLDKEGKVVFWKMGLVTDGKEGNLYRSKHTIVHTIDSLLKS